MSDAELDPGSLFDIELPAQPYPGLRSFEKDEWPIYFGRELIAGEVIERLIDKQFLTVHGDSGCGKSSLIRAGVMPRLERDHARGGATWRTASMLPRNAPLRNLASALASLATSRPDERRLTEIRRLLNAGANAPELLSTQLRRGQKDYICLLVDQFEEVFAFAERGGRGEAEQFIELLVNFQQAGTPGLHLVLTMRSEFLGRCAHFERLAESINETQFLLPRMDKQSLIRAIREPARFYGGEVSGELTEILIADAGQGQDQLPLIQHALLLMQQHAIKATRSPSGSWTITLGDYLQSGGLAKILSNHADGVLEEIKRSACIPDADAGKLVECVFKALTSLDSEGRGVRRPQTISQLAAVTGTTRERLLSFITPLCQQGVSFLKIYGNPPYTEDELVDISHEALIRNWDRLAQWVNAEKNDSQIFERLVNLAGADSQMLLGEQEAEQRKSWWERLAPTEAWAERYGGNYHKVRSLLDRSNAAAKVARRRRYVQRVLIPMSGVFLLFGLVTGYAFWEARTQRQIAEARADVAIQETYLAKERAKLSVDKAEKARAEAEESKQRDIADILKQVSSLGEENLRIKKEAQAIRARLVVTQAQKNIDNNDYAATLKTILDGMPQDLGPDITGKFDQELTSLLKRTIIGAPILSSWAGAASSPGISSDATGQRVMTRLPLEKLKVWRTETNRPIAEVPGYEGALSPDGHRLISQQYSDLLDFEGRPTATVIVWDADTGLELYRKSVSSPSYGRRISVSWSPDTSRFSIANASDSADIFDTKTGNKITTIRMPKAGPSDGDILTLNSVVFSPDSRLAIALGQLLSTARIFDATTGEELRVLKGHVLRRGLVRAASFSADGTRIITGGEDGLAIVWDAEKGTQITSITHNAGVGVHFVSFDPNNRERVLSASFSAIRLSDTGGRISKGISASDANGRLVKNFDDSDGEILTAQFTEDGNIFWATSRGRASLWNQDQGELWSMNFPDDVKSAIYLRGGRAVTASAQGIVRQWRVGPNRDAKNLDQGDFCTLVSRARKLLHAFYPSEQEQTFSCSSG